MTETSGKRPPSRTVIWLRAMRLVSLPAALVPLMVGGGLASLAERPVDWLLIVWMTLSASAMLLAVNIRNDIDDHDRGLDKPGQPFGAAGSGVLPDGLLTRKEMKRALFLLMGIAAVSSVPLIYARGTAVLALGIAGFSLGLLYTAKPFGLKYLGLGDPLVFLLMGPLMVSGVDWILTGELVPARILAGLPVGLVAVLILHCNNWRDLDSDREAGTLTVAIRLGERGSSFYAAVLAYGAILIAAGAALAGAVPYLCLLVFLCLPKASAILRLIREGREAYRRRGPRGDPTFHAAQLHLLFGLLYAAGLFFG